MNNSGAIAEKMKGIREKFGPGFQKTGAVFSKIGHVFGLIGTWIFKLRRIFMAIPVLYTAFRIAAVNMERLPEQVGLNLQASGEFAQMVSREYAVYGPLGVTVLCLLLMFLTRKATYPWVISIFTLILPFMIYFINIYPA